MIGIGGNEQNSRGFVTRLATVIVDKRYLVFLITAALLIFSVFSRGWVEVENDLVYYLPDGCETKIALRLMEEQFTTFGSAEVMVANISYNDALELSRDIAGLRGVQSVGFDNTPDHYNNVSALFSVTFDCSEKDGACLDALERVKTLLAGRDLYISTDLGNPLGEIIQSEVNTILVYVAFIVVTVLLLASRTFGEVPVLLLTFLTAMILNQGSNFLLGKISFVSNSVTSILQLALSLDYAIIMCSHFKEANRTMPVRDAAIDALRRAMSEISASSLTTIGGLIAMLFMEFRIGADMSVCLIKSILFSMLTVFTVMPGLLVLFGPLIERTEHREFIPKVSFIGRFAYKTRHAVPILFIVLAAAGFIISSRCPFAYGYSNLTTPKLNYIQIARNMIKDNFSSPNTVALVVPSGDYERERELVRELESCKEIRRTMGLVNIPAIDGYCLADELSPRRFSETVGTDYETARLLYGAYAAEKGNYGMLLGGLGEYRVPLIDIFLFACEQADRGLIELSDEQQELLSDARDQMNSALRQLSGPDFTRIMVYLDLPVNSDQTYAFIDTLRGIAQKYYPDDEVFVAGDPTTGYDFKKSFTRDNLVVSAVSVAIVLVVLLFTFRSAGMPLLLILVIQGSIWVNFSVPVFTGKGLFFIGYLVVTAIQMGANIDYAIVIASRYQELKGRMDHRQAMTETLNFAFPTIITSGTILIVSGLLIGNMTSEPTIAGIGASLGRGTIISVFLVLFALPQILLLGSDIADRTSFSVPHAVERHCAAGRIAVDGMVSGEIHGTVSGILRGTVEGEVDLNIISGHLSRTAPPEGHMSGEEGEKREE